MRGLRRSRRETAAEDEFDLLSVIIPFFPLILPLTASLPCFSFQPNLSIVKGEPVSFKPRLPARAWPDSFHLLEGSHDVLCGFGDDAYGGRRGPGLARVRRLPLRVFGMFRQCLQRLSRLLGMPRLSRLLGLPRLPGVFRMLGK